MAAVWKLPLVLVIENNRYAFSTPGAAAVRRRAARRPRPGLRRRRPRPSTATIPTPWPTALRAAPSPAPAPARDRRCSRRCSAACAATPRATTRSRSCRDGRARRATSPPIRCRPTRGGSRREGVLDADAARAARRAHRRAGRGRDRRGLAAAPPVRRWRCARSSRRCRTSAATADGAAATGRRPGGATRRLVLRSRRAGEAAEDGADRDGRLHRRRRRRRPPARSTYLDAIHQALARGDGARPVGGPDGPGHRRLRGRVPRHHGAPRALARSACSTRRSPRAARSASPSARRSSAIRPVVEMQFADFVSCGFNQLVNVAAKLYYRFERALPDRGPPALGRRRRRRAVPLAEPRGLVRPHRRPQGRLPGDRARRQGACMKAAIRDPNPVIFCEHKFLYRRIKERAAGGRRSWSSSARRGSRARAATSRWSATAPRPGPASRRPTSWRRRASRPRSSTCAPWCRSTRRRCSPR